MGGPFVDQDELQWSGRRLNKNIYSAYGCLLLAADTLLTDEMLENLAANGVRLTDEDVRPDEDQCLDRILDAAAEMKSIYGRVRETEQIPVEDIYVRYIPKLRRILNKSGLISVLSELQRLDDYTYQHNVAVGVISTLIGKWLGYDEAELTGLSLAATLHDIGKVKVPEPILNKPEDLTADEFELMKQHTVFGYDLILNSLGPGRVADVALQHHEREDGSGYPFGLHGHEIDEMSKIVAVADVFHAMTSKRVYKESAPFHLVMRQMWDCAFGSLSPAITTLFVKKVMESLIGSEVRLSDGHPAVIVMIHPDDPPNPVVRREGEFIDLSCRKDLNIVTFL
jgi:HD-GYP domain-containing protein (c-di-GMP phosphodiesterase class II)